MITEGDDAELPTDHERGRGAADVVSPSYAPFDALSVLAAETGQAIRQTLTKSGVGTSGHVKQGLQHHTSPYHDAYPGQPDEAGVLPKSDAVTSEQGSLMYASASVISKAVQADINLVRRKLVSTDAATEVILRFNFLGGGESKVHHYVPAERIRRVNVLGATSFWLFAGCFAVCGSLNTRRSCCADS